MTSGQLSPCQFLHLQQFQILVPQDPFASLQGCLGIVTWKFDATILNFIVAYCYVEVGSQLMKDCNKLMRRQINSGSVVHHHSVTRLLLWMAIAVLAEFMDAFNKMNTMETGQMTLPMKKWSCGISALPGGSTVPTFIIVEEAMQLISERIPSDVPALTGFF